MTSTREDRAASAQMWTLARSLGIDDRIEFLGFVPYEDLPRYYSVADVLIQTGTASVTGATTMSLPVKEALACGTAVVRSDATDEDVEDGVSGYLVDPADVEATGARLATLLGDRERARTMGEAGRGRIVELYRWDRVVDIVLEAVLVSRAHSSPERAASPDGSSCGSSSRTGEGRRARSGHAPRASRT